MKKILLAISALSAALFSTAANADISVSGSANAVYVDADGNSQGHVGGTISFSMSTTTDGGVTISTGGQITNDPDAAGGAGTASGMTALTFGFANGSITVADDVAVPAGTGLVGELVTHADSNQVTHTNDVTLATDDGSGISASTSLGDMTVAGATYVYDGGHNQNIDGGTTTGAGASLTIPLGDMSLVVSSSQVDDVGGTEDSSAGGALTMTAGGGTLSLGIETTSGDTAATEGEAYSVSYSTTLGGGAVAVGYTGFDANSNTSNKTDVTLSQSIGGGASIFAELQQLNRCWCSCRTQTTSEGVVAVGTSVSF